MVDLVLDNRYVDLIYENFDLAVRDGKSERQELIVRRIGSIRRVLAASPEYLQRAGLVDSLVRLSEVGIVTTTTILSPRDALTLCQGDATVEIPVPTASAH